MKYFDRVGPLFQEFVTRVDSPIQKFVDSGLDTRLLRRIVGGLGMALPIVVVVWGLILHSTVQGSISDYYAWRTRDAFVGILFVIGWILFAYQKRDDKNKIEKMDSIAGKLAWLFAMGVALFPNSGTGWERTVHLSCATGLFFVLAFFSLVLFTKTNKSPKGFKPTLKRIFCGDTNKVARSMTPKKRTRNTIYRICGFIIIACLIMVALYYWLWQNTAISVAKPVFILEWLMIWAFGFAWLVKGEIWWKENPNSQDESK